MQVYLPDDLYAEVKAQELPASELLQQAVRAELRRRALLEETDRYIEELVAEVGAPSARDLAAAEELVARLGLSKTAAVTR
jgi:post-segregation antitoxin (ccd killing protein)